MWVKSIELKEQKPLTPELAQVLHLFTTGAGQGPRFRFV